MSTEWLKELSDDERLRAIVETFGKVAGTPDGEVVFRFILDGLFDPILDDEQRIRHNQQVEYLQLFPGAVKRMYAALLQQETR